MGVHYRWERNMHGKIWYLRKLKMDLPFDPAIPLLGIYPKEPTTLIRKDIRTLMFTEALFTITKI